MYLNVLALESIDNIIQKLILFVSLFFGEEGFLVRKIRGGGGRGEALHTALQTLWKVRCNLHQLEAQK